MTPEEILELRNIFRKKYASLHRTPEEFWEKGSREQAWDELMESLKIARLSKMMHLVVPPTPEEVRVEEPMTDRYLRIPRETARKILVLGLP